MYCKMNIDWQNVIDTVVDWCTSVGIKLIVSLVLLFVSFRLINYISRKINRKLIKKDVDKTINKVLVYIIKLTLKILVVLCLMGYVGIETTSFSALIASIGVGVGLAINGTLANFAGGIMILITRPFKLDDFIETQDVSGTVEDIRIVYTKLVTPDNKVVYLPNGNLSTGTIINYSEKNIRRVDMIFSISYQNNASKAIEIIENVCNNNKLILTVPAKIVKVSGYANSSIDITCKAWVNRNDYWTVYFELLEQIKAEFDNNNIEIPYQQVDVHIKDDCKIKK